MDLLTLIIVTPAILAAVYFYVQWQRTKVSLDGTRSLLQQTEVSRDAAVTERNSAREELVAANTRVEETHKRLDDWERNKQESLKLAEATMLKSGKEAFTTEAKTMQEHFNKVTQVVSALHSQVNKTDGRMETVIKSLSSPSNIGQFSEIGLENTLKQYGLRAGTDFISQFAAKNQETQSNLRPDFVVFLPGGNALVIDSKASKFFFELAEAEGTDAEQAIMEKLIKRMHDHIKSLSSKGYKDAVTALLKQSAGQNRINHVFTVMYLHSEGSIEKICLADPQLRRACEEKDIVLSGPSGLASILSAARYEIGQQQRSDNNAEIIDTLSQLLGSIETSFKHALGVGKSLQSAAQNYQKFVGSVNTQLLPKTKKLTGMGVALPKGKTLPQKLQSFSIITDSTPLIEGESEAVDTAEEKLSLELESADK